jgi:Tol biopolymer transport system component
MPNPEFSDVFIAHPDGTDLTQVTSSAHGSFSYGPVWSPNGTKLLFIRGSRADSTRISGQDVAYVDLWTANVDGTGVAQLTDITAEYEQYFWTT